MKLLRDFLLLCTPDRSLWGGRGVRCRSLTITVPEPLTRGVGTVTIDMHWQADPATGRLTAHWHEHTPT